MRTFADKNELASRGALNRGTTPAVPCHTDPGVNALTLAGGRPVFRMEYFQAGPPRDHPRADYHIPYGIWFQGYFRREKEPGSDLATVLVPGHSPSAAAPFISACILETPTEFTKQYISPCSESESYSGFCGANMNSSRAIIRALTFLPRTSSSRVFLIEAKTGLGERGAT